MPVVGDWTVPPERSRLRLRQGQEKSSPGYYSVYLDDFKTKAEMTATDLDGHLPLHFPRTEKRTFCSTSDAAAATIRDRGRHTVRGISCATSAEPPASSPSFPALHRISAPSSRSIPHEERRVLVSATKM